MGFQLLCNIPLCVFPHFVHTHTTVAGKFTLCIFLRFLAPLRRRRSKACVGLLRFDLSVSYPYSLFIPFCLFLFLFYPSDGTQIQLREHFKKTKGTQPQSDIEPSQGHKTEDTTWRVKGHRQTPTSTSFYPRTASHRSVA